MAYQALIRKNATGEERLYTIDSDWDENSAHMWTDGNYGCDCNRALFFARAGGAAESDENPCSESVFTIPYAILPNGERVEIDGAIWQTESAG